MSAIVTRAPEERAIGAEGEPVPTVRADVLRALLWTSAALRACRKDDRDVIRGKGDCAWMGSRTVGEILDEADAVLNGLARPDPDPAADPRGRADG